MLKYFIIAIFFGFAAVPLQAAEQTVRIADLEATLLTPDNPGTGFTHRVALIVAGSGPVDRDGNVGHIKNNSLKFLAEGLANAGIASLRYDKRGIGKSNSGSIDENNMRFSGNVDDALILYDWLQKDVRFSNIFLIGHSEGALVVTLAAQQREGSRSKLKAAILLAGAGSPAADILKAQLLKAKLPEALSAEALEALSRLQKGKRVEHVSKEIKAIFRQSVQNYLISWFAIDPAKELSRLKIPVLIVSGGQDIQVAPAEAIKLAGASPNSQILHIEDMNHILKASPDDRSQNLATYNQPDRKLVPKLVPALAAFMNAQK